MSSDDDQRSSRSHIERVAGSRRVRLVPDNDGLIAESDIQDLLKDDSQNRRSSFENEERLKRDVPPHW